ncbi:hypothetical protein EG327_003835 [Venturia inaequalis]|uniref:Uncharacterized protein n=1 Tax=Venturia inaequalis TaxID=5025 RepID=A0A8H3VE60_VENIN|nr:hypothetical protein EG327_003835 [Venturia inaequalis]
MATEEPAESTGSRELPEYYQNLRPFSIGDSMRDFDNPGTTNELNRLVMNPHSQNFIVDFGDDEAWCGFELTADAYSTLLKARRPPELNTRWINIWTPYQQKDIIETLAAHYDFTPRLRSFMLSKPLDFSTSSSSSGSSKTSFFHRHSRPKTSSALPNSSNEDRHGLGAEKSSPDSSTHASSSHDAENQIGLMNSASPSNYRSMDDLNIYNMANNIWHFQTVDWGRRYLSVGYNNLHSTPRRKRTVWEKELYRDKPHGQRVWSWIILCEDKTVISIYEDPFWHQRHSLTENEKRSLAVVRRNTVNVFRQLSRGYDHSHDSARQELPLRTRLGNVDEETTHRPSDMPGLLFYYLFDDWENIYSYIARGHGYAEEIDKLRECMLQKAELEHVDRLHHIGRKLGVLKRLYQSYESIIEQVLKRQEATLASLKNSQVFPSGIHSTEQSLGQLADPNLMGVPLSSAARVRFETLRGRIRLYALNEVEECLLQKESLTMVNFNLIAIKESYSVERLTRVTLVLAKVTMLFMPVSLMTGYFSSQLTDATFSVKSYWISFAVVLFTSIFGLIVFDVFSATSEGKMDMKSYGTKFKGFEYTSSICSDNDIILHLSTLAFMNYLESENIPTWQLVLLSIVGYVYLCRVLRYRRLQQKHALYPYKNREDFAKMTNQHAYEIQKYLFGVEFPFTMQKALEFALFRTYGIPSISSLLVKTKQLSEKQFASKRYADTVVLISEFMAWSPEAERTNAAIARMNYLHSLYQKKNLISNDDMLYTLSLFATEPCRWVNRYEWRQMTEMETCAM